MSRSTKRVIALLLLLDQDDSGGHRLSDLATELGAPKSSLVPVLRELQEAGLVERSSDSRYRAGPRFRRFGKAAATSDGSPAAAFAASIEQIRQELHAHGVSILLWDATDGLLRPIYSFSIAGHESVTVRPGEGIAGQVWATKRSVMVPDYMLWEHAIPRFRSQIWRAHIGAPVVSRGEMIGVIVVRSHDESLTFDAADVARVEQIAALMGEAIS